MNVMIGGTLMVENVPEKVKGESGYMVVILDDAKLWYFGLYETEEMANRAASEGFNNRFVFKV